MYLISCLESNRKVLISLIYSVILATKPSKLNLEFLTSKHNCFSFGIYLLKYKGRRRFSDHQVVEQNRQRFILPFPN